MAYLLDQSRKRTQQYVSLSWGVLAGLLRALDTRDGRAGRHSAAVARFARDMAAAVRLYQVAAEKGLPSAQFRLGLALIDGASVDQDIAAGEAWMRRAALTCTGMPSGWLAGPAPFIGPRSSALRSQGRLWTWLPSIWGKAALGSWRTSAVAGAPPPWRWPTGSAGPGSSPSISHRSSPRCWTAFVAL